MLADKAPAWCDRLGSLYRRSHGGVVAAFATEGQAWFRASGVLSREDPRAPDADTLFEVGSLTKVFTALLLARLVLDGRLGLDTPVAGLLPGLRGVPAWVTPRALATHTAGLPRIPAKVLWAGPRNPYARFGGEDLEGWMRAWRPSRPPKPGKPAYSNLGAGLLGHVLGHLAGKPYPEALRDLVLAPLGLHDTGCALDPARAARLAQPHGSWGRPVAPWDFDALAGAGALRSSARDLARFGQAVLAAPRGAGPLAAAINLTLEVQVPGAMAFIPGWALGWVALAERQTGVRVYHHDGATRGSSASFFASPAAGFVLLALSNTKTSLLTSLRQVRLDMNGLLHEAIVGTGAVGGPPVARAS